MNQQDLYARLELIPADFEPSANLRIPQVARPQGHLKARLGQAGHALLNYFCGSTAPRITVSQTRDSQSPGGHRPTQYRVYDPITDQRHSFRSEAELREWLDQRYYR